MNNTSFKNVDKRSYSVPKEVPKSAPLYKTNYLFSNNTTHPLSYGKFDPNFKYIPVNYAPSNISTYKVPEMQQFSLHNYQNDYLPYQSYKSPNIPIKPTFDYNYNSQTIPSRPPMNYTSFTQNIPVKSTLSNASNSTTFIASKCKELNNELLTKESDPAVTSILDQISTLYSKYERLKETKAPSTFGDNLYAKMENQQPTIPKYESPLQKNAYLSVPQTKTSYSSNNLYKEYPSTSLYDRPNTNKEHLKQEYSQPTNLFGHYQQYEIEKQKLSRTLYDDKLKEIPRNSYKEQLKKNSETQTTNNEMDHSDFMWQENEKKDPVQTEEINNVPVDEPNQIKKRNHVNLVNDVYSNKNYEISETTSEENEIGTGSGTDSSDDEIKMLINSYRNKKNNNEMFNIPTYNREVKDKKNFIFKDTTPTKLSMPLFKITEGDQLISTFPIDSGESEEDEKTKNGNIQSKSNTESNKQSSDDYLDYETLLKYNPNGNKAGNLDIASCR